MRPRTDKTGERAHRPAATRRGVLQRALRRILGMPDYGAYLEHCRRAGHPSDLTEREFIDEFFERRGRATRCC